MYTALHDMMIMIDIDVLGAEVMKGGDQGVALLITTIEDLTVLEIDRLEDHGVAEAIPTMIDQTAAGIPSTVLLTTLQERSESGKKNQRRAVQATKGWVEGAAV